MTIRAVLFTTLVATTLAESQDEQGTVDLLLDQFSADIDLEEDVKKDGGPPLNWSCDEITGLQVCCRDVAIANMYKEHDKHFRSCDWVKTLTCEQGKTELSTYVHDVGKSEIDAFIVSCSSRRLEAQNLENLYVRQVEGQQKLQEEDGNAMAFTESLAAKHRHYPHGHYPHGHYPHHHNPHHHYPHGHNPHRHNPHIHTPYPTPFPTPFPTPHPCDNGSHGCDKSAAGICYKIGGNRWSCDCIQTHWCSSGCDQPHNGHACTVVTPSPTTTPTPSPTKAPTRETGPGEGCTFDESEHEGTGTSCMSWDQNDVLRCYVDETGGCVGGFVYNPALAGGVAK